jgi:hypothetical protein
VSDYPRLCPKCRVLTDRDGFTVDRSKASSRKSHCRRCDTERALRYHYKHAERISARKAAKRAEVAIERERLLLGPDALVGERISRQTEAFRLTPADPGRGESDRTPDRR